MNDGFFFTLFFTNDIIFMFSIIVARGTSWKTTHFTQSFLVPHTIFINECCWHMLQAYARDSYSYLK
jgi:hypothetical protein